MKSSMWGGGSLRIIGVQLIGIGSCFVWRFGPLFIFLNLVDLIAGLRVSPEEKVAGLDTGEHGVEAYAPDHLHHGIPAEIAEVSATS